MIALDFINRITNTRAGQVCVCVCVCVRCGSCEIISKTKMIVFTEEWVHCEIDITMCLEISFLFSV